MLCECDDCGEVYDPENQWDHCPHRKAIHMTRDPKKISPPLHMAAFDWRKVGTGLLLAILGAILTALEEYVSGIDFSTLTPETIGDLTAYIVAINSALVNIARKFLFTSRANA